jgi:hypothetical protein
VAAEDMTLFDKVHKLGGLPSIYLICST